MSNKTNIEPKHIEKNGKLMLIAGLSRSFALDMDVPGQWMQFNSQQNEIPDKIGSVAYGLCINMGNEKESKYLSGIEVSGVEQLPESFSHKQLPALSYAVFQHNGHVSTIRQTIDATNTWINNSEYELAEEADFFFERYGEQFNPRTGKGDIEVWIPVKK